MAVSERPSDLIDAAVLDGLVARVAALIATSTRPRVLIGIAGPPGSGKTTLAGALVHRLAGTDDWRGTRAAHLPMDGFHLADVELDRLGLRDRKGVPETFDADGYAAALERVAAGESVYAPSFERDLEQPIAGALPVTSATRVVVSEGNYLLLPGAPWRRARAQFDEVWFCRVDPAERRDRLVARHVEFGKSQDEAVRWMAAVDEPNGRLVDATAADADLLLDPAPVRPRMP